MGVLLAESSYNTESSMETHMETDSGNNAGEVGTMRKTAEQNVKAVYKHAHIAEDDYFYVYVYHEPCDDRSCCPSKLWRDRFVGQVAKTERSAWNWAWKEVQFDMLRKLEEGK